MIYGISFQGQYDLWQQLCSDDDATNLVMGKTIIRQGNAKLQAILGRYWNEETRTFLTVTDAISGTSYQAYRLPENFRTLSDFYVTVGTTQYRADLIQDYELWRQINATTTQSTSNYVEFVFIMNDRILLWPIPSSACTATIIYRTIDRQLINADYTTGTITTLANGGTAVTGSGTTFTNAMKGRYFQINSDGGWYKILTYTSATAIVLAEKYQGEAISAGTETYKIGELPNLPPDTHDLPVYYAVWRWALFRKDVQLAREYERMWKEGVTEARRNWSNRDSSAIIHDKSRLMRFGVKNPNNYPLNMS
jgi:hypothetical protein